MKVRNYVLGVKERVFTFDNSKALLIFLVVLGHFVDYYTDISRNMQVLFFFIYIFHMPLFIFIAGLFSKSTINKSPFRIDRVLTFLLLYFILEIVLYLMLHVWFGSESYDLTMFSEDGVSWFMFAMAAWLCIGYFLNQFKPKYVLIGTTVLALLVGYDKEVGDFLVASRIIVYLPFFMAGYYTNPQKLAGFLQQKSVRITSGIILLLTIAFIYFNIDLIYGLRPLLSGRNAYVVAGLPVMGGFIRLGLMIVTTIVSLAVMAIMPNKKTWYTVIGVRSLQVYFLHRFILFIYQHYHLNDYLAKISPNHWLEIYLCFAAILTLLLSWKGFGWILIKIQSISYVRFKKQEEVVRQ